eukprot:CAMPEP_0119343638 /NCGR_PEP_ID=MMETSP1333-20130426/106554_1 /TAXON_ID=418940 /ORGANISM="Scyphosphaera apsteinii, Strain RCC1455" /LENGTH=548 /DNA_ID=CAMNT_0007356041 /DNA_START=109 /DNA_END=1755 /DNA_ORIENTATION=+
MSARGYSLMMLSLSTVVALGLNVAPRSLSPSTSLRRAPAALMGMPVKKVPTKVAVVPSGLSAGVIGKVVNAKGGSTKSVPAKPTVSTALLNACGLSETTKAGLLKELFLSTGAVVTASEGAVIVEGVVAPTPGDAITNADVISAQDAWSNAITSISKAYLENGDFVAAAGYCAGELYGYGHSNVLFKPTKAAEFPFRPTGGEAMSYFVGGGVVDKGYDEDAGFAINGGKGWADVKFTNHQIDLNGDVAIAMGSYVFTCATTGDEVTVEYTFGYKKNADGKMRGSYVFTCATTGDEVTVEYTFGYKKNADGKMRIFLHHSSVPYTTKSAAVTEAEVLAAQDSWAGAIIFISKVYAEKGDYISAAGAAASELYGYGHSNVLFKPTKAAKFPFRPTGGEAMSYFVGGGVVDNGYDEDAGFAINGGKGWKNVKFTNHQVDLNGDVAIAMGSYVFTCATTGDEVRVEYTFAINGGKGWKNVKFTNHQVDLNGDVAIAMGSYVFTCATTGDEVRVEYTFGYKRCADGKLRIFLHHSSVPYVVPPNVEHMKPKKS